mgnify:CR=1 FL=1
MTLLASRIIRYSFAGLFLWFGYMQLSDPSLWVGFLPQFLGYMPIPAEMIVQLNGWFELLAAAGLLFGVYVRPIAAVLSMHLLLIAVSVGGAIGVRDGILAVMGVSLAANTSPDPFTLDAKK